MSPKIPLILKLKKTRHKNIVVAQDIIVQELYKVFEKAVIHGGTAIWRCYDGNRFSEDVDVYIERNQGKLDSLFANLQQLGFTVKKKKTTDNSLYSNLEYEGTQVRFEALFKKAKGILKEYEKADSNLITIYTLSAETLIVEKVNAYSKRRKIRDLYDIFFLLRYVENRNHIKSSLDHIINNYKPPVDIQDLKALIIIGIAPSPKEMMDYIKRQNG
jgi:predicted nucleotidyltransferase component of viral defense system